MCLSRLLSFFVLRQSVASFALLAAEQSYKALSLSHSSTKYSDARSRVICGLAHLLLNLGVQKIRFACLVLALERSLGARFSVRWKAAVSFLVIYFDVFLCSQESSFLLLDWNNKHAPKKMESPPTLRWENRLFNLRASCRVFISGHLRLTGNTMLYPFLLDYLIF